jgi:putative spermidine/putrescine transport system ATP-binding protein
VTVAGNPDFIIKVPNAHGHAVLAEGAMIKVGWSAEDCRALDA